MGSVFVPVFERGRWVVWDLFITALVVVAVVALIVVAVAAFVVAVV